MSRCVVAGLAAVLALCAASARAETLAEALALAYRSNPVLQSQRALQRQLDETYVQARAGWRPVLNGGANASWSQGEVFGGQRVNRNIGSASLTASQPIYTGGRASAAVEAAEAAVRAGRETLRAQEQTVLQQVVAAYRDVLRDQAIVSIRLANLSVLQTQLTETQARLEVGQLTRTEVAQSQAQVAAARALLSSAQAQVQISRAAYAAVVGQNPGELAPPPTLPGLPLTVEEAFSTAEAANPTLNRARMTEMSSRARVAQLRAQRRPTVAVQGSVGYAGPLSPFNANDFSRALSASAVLTQPLFAGGIIASNVRAATEQNTSDRIQIEVQRRAVVQLVSQTWNLMLASGGNIASNLEQARAAQVALEGFQEQYRVGLATNLDVLLAQQQQQSAQLALVQSERDQYVAQANLLNAMGRLDARSLVTGATFYDPRENFERVKRFSRVPWEPLIEAVDSLFRPLPGELPDAPPLEPSEPGEVALRPAEVQPATPQEQPLATAVPVRPEPGD